MSPKMKKIGLLVSLLASMPAWAQTGGVTHVGGGGETIDINGRPTLRDLVDKSVCIAPPAQPFSGGLPHFPKIIESISKVHPAFAEALIDAERPLNICLTEGPLVQVATEDQYGVTIIVDTPTKRQAAIRFNSEVYIDNSILRRMTPQGQAYLYTHEIAHSFIPMATENRNGKLRSLIAALEQNEKKTMSRVQFNAQLSLSSVDGSRYARRLLTAILQGNENLVRNELERGVDPNTTFLQTHNPDAHHYEAMPALVLAAKLKHTSIVKLLLEQPSIKVNAATSTCKSTALHLAAMDGNLEMAGLLVNIPGIDVNAKNWFEATPLYMTTATMKDEVARMLIAIPGVDVNEPSILIQTREYNGKIEKTEFYQTPLCMAVDNTNFPVFRALLDAPGINTSVPCSGSGDIFFTDNQRKAALQFGIGRYGLPGSDAKTRIESYLWNHVKKPDSSAGEAARKRLLYMQSLFQEHQTGVANERP